MNLLVVFDSNIRKRAHCYGKRMLESDHQEPDFVSGAEEAQTRLLPGPNEPKSPPPQPLEHFRGGKSVGRRADRGLKTAQRLPGLAAELAVRGAAIKPALRQKLLQFQ